MGSKPSKMAKKFQSGSLESSRMRLKDAVDNSFRTARIFERALRVFEIVATEPVFTAELGETLMVMPWKQSSPPYLVHLTKKNISQFCQRLDKGWLPKEEMFALRMGLSEKTSISSKSLSKQRDKRVRP
jgi:hypothetical protein